MNGIIVRCSQVRLADFEGEYSYLGTTLRQANIEPMPSLSDVRRLVTEFGILPLGKTLCLFIHINVNFIAVKEFSLFETCLKPTSAVVFSLYLNISKKCY